MKECPTCRRCFSDQVNFCGEDGISLASTLSGEPVLDGRYRLEIRIGQGGMGIVYRAHHIYLKTVHAIKVILPELIHNDPTLVTRFRQEAMAAAAIRHPNIVTVTDFGVVEGRLPFLVMEFVQGRSLEEVITADGAMTPTRALEFFVQIVAGVSAAHRHQIIHRDLKPLNIMIQDDRPANERVKILDFGLAKIKSSELLGSFIPAKTIAMIGTPHYMAPEQWSDEESDERTDIYSLGVILFQMLTGHLPFEGTSVPSIMRKHLLNSPPTFSSFGIHDSSRLEAVVRHALEKERERRPQTIENLSNEIRTETERFQMANTWTKITAPGL
jgi:eukaryotic-like serine/threonine-protein kinase